ncbi:23622_t:CDS:1, partial [Cetraspora pellucida]
MLYLTLVVLDLQLKFYFFELLNLSPQLIIDIKNIIKDKSENKYASFSDQNTLHETITQSTLIAQIYKQININQQ